MYADALTVPTFLRDLIHVWALAVASTMAFSVLGRQRPHSTTPLRRRSRGLLTAQLLTPDRSATRSITQRHDLAVVRNTCVPPEAAADRCGELVGGVRLTMHDEHLPRWALEAAQPMKEVLPIRMGR